MFKKIFILILSLLLSNYSFSQDDFSDESSDNAEQIITLSGSVIDASKGKPLQVQMLLLMKLTLGQQQMRMVNSPLKVFSLVGVTASAIGYDDLTLYADQANLSFELTPSTVEMSELEVLASRASQNSSCIF